jgi:hypothetical protein
MTKREFEQSKRHVSKFIGDLRAAYAKLTIPGAVDHCENWVKSILTNLEHAEKNRTHNLAAVRSAMDNAGREYRRAAEGYYARFDGQAAILA